MEAGAAPPVFRFRHGGGDLRTQGVQIVIADLQAVEHLAKSLALGHAGQQNGQIAGQGLFLAAQFLAVVALVVDAQRPSGRVRPVRPAPHRSDAA